MRRGQQAGLEGGDTSSRSARSRSSEPRSRSAVAPTGNSTSVTGRRSTFAPSCGPSGHPAASDQRVGVEAAAGDDLDVGQQRRQRAHDRADQPGALPDGAATRCSVLHRRHHRRARLAARHRRRRGADRPVATASSRCSSRRRWPRSSPRCWSRWCWCSGRRACSARRRDERSFAGKGLAAASRRHRCCSSALQLRAAGLSSRPARPHHGAGGLRHGLQLLFGYVGLLSLGHAMFFSRRALRRRPRRHPSRLERAGGLRSPASPAARCWRWSIGAAGAAHHRRRLHDRHHDVRAGVLPHHPLFRAWTGGDEGLVVPQPARVLTFGATALDLTNPTVRYMSRAGAVLGRAADHAGHRPLPLWPRAGRHPRERGAHEDARLRHLLQQARRRRRLRHHLRGRRAPPMRCCSAMSARASPRCNIRSCRCCGCCSAAPPRRSGR